MNKVTALITDARIGSIIIEGTKRIVVKHIDAGCTRHKVHINRNACYDRGAYVELANADYINAGALDLYHAQKAARDYFVRYLERLYQDAA